MIMRPDLRQPRWPTALLLLGLGALGSVEASADTLSSSKYAILVHYSDSSYKSKAQTVLAAAEGSWAYQVETLGFPAPPADKGQGGSDDFDIYIESDSMTQAHGAYTTTTIEAPGSKWGYCTKMVIDPSLPSSALQLIVSHEFHHAVQTGIAVEGNNIDEAGAVYISGLELPGQAWHLSYYLGFNAFQEHPERSLDWEDELGDFYPYGGALYLMFLDEVYGGGGTPGIFVRKIWDAIGSVTDPSTAKFMKSYPSYLDAIASLVTFDEAFKKFVRWRYFVGTEDDGHHFKDLANWVGAGTSGALESVALDADLKASALPVSTRKLSSPPMPYGAAYVRLSLAGLKADEKVRLTVAGDSKVSWVVEAIAIPASGAATESEVAVGKDGKLTTDFTVGKATKLVLAFANLGDGAYYADGACWSSNALSYSLAKVATPAPKIESVSPSELAAGAEEAELEVKGSSFPSGTPTLTISCASATVGAVTVASSGTVRASVTVDPAAADETCDVTLRWSASSSATSTGALAIVAAPPPEETGSGGGCSAAPGGPAPRGAAWIAALVLLVALSRRRR
jgi:MYXO-CTERM domain-containing protein